MAEENVTATAVEKKAEDPAPTLPNPQTEGGGTPNLPHQIDPEERDKDDPREKAAEALIGLVPEADREKARRLLEIVAKAKKSVMRNTFVIKERKVRDKTTKPSGSNEFLHELYNGGHSAADVSKAEVSNASGRKPLSY